MGFIELLLIAIGLSMDAFAVAICKGLSMQRLSLKKMLTIGLYFGIFQALMPLVGYFAGSLFATYIMEYDHWIAFVLLGFIGGHMIYQSFQKEEKQEDTLKLTFREMFPLSIATSIDALAVGISFAFFKVQVASAVVVIGSITLVLSMIGVKVGNVFGMKYKSKAEFAGGVVLILIGLKILLDHLEVF